MGKDGGDGCPCHIHVEDRDEEEVSQDVHDTGDGDKDEGHNGVPKSTEYAADDVVGDDEEDTAAADADVSDGEVEGFVRSLQEDGQWAGEDRQEEGQDQ